MIATSTVSQKYSLLAPIESRDDLSRDYPSTN